MKKCVKNDGDPTVEFCPAELNLLLCRAITNTVSMYNTDKPYSGIITEKVSGFRLIPPGDETAQFIAAARQIKLNLK